MVEFRQCAAPAGVLHLPDAVAREVAPAEVTLRELELITRGPDEIAAMDDADTLDLLTAVRKRKAALEAMEARSLARLDDLRAGDRYTPDEAALEMRISPHHAAGKLATAAALSTRMPGVLGLMDAGEVDGYTAGRIVDACRGLSDADAHEVDRLLTDKHAAGQLNPADPTSVRRAVRRLAAVVDPDAVAARAHIARGERKVELVHGEDAMSTLVAELPAEVAASAYGRIDADARRLRASGAERTLDQLRADVLARLLTSTVAGGTPSDGAVVFVHMPVDAAVGISDDGCELAGYGPIPGTIAREIMTNPASVLRKVVEDPTTGAIEGLGRRRYRPDQALRDLIAVRDRECVHCHRPAARCDADHLTEYARGGATDPTNLGAKCRRHHNHKDHPDWTLEHHPTTGESRITTPGGRVYTRRRQPLCRRTQPAPQRRTPPQRDRPPPF